jgi:hypothetical protein
MKKIYESPDGGKTIRERDFMSYMSAKIHATSAYNDGWTQEHYKKIVEGYEKDKVVKWILPVQKNEDGELFINLPEDLLEEAKLEEGDTVDWINNGDGTFKVVKGNKSLTYDEMIANGWEMTADGFWIKNS